MNLIALASAICGLAVLVLVVIFGNKITNRWLRYLAIVAGVIVGIGVTGNIPLLLGDTAMTTSAKAGEYLLYLGILAVVVKFLFFRKKADGNVK